MTRSKSPDRVTASSLDPATSPKKQKTVSRAPRDLAPRELELAPKKMLSIPYLLAAVALLCVIAGALPCMMSSGDCPLPGRTILQECSSCEGAVALSEGATVPAEFAGVTYLLADKAAADAFVAAPEDNIDLLTKFTSLWTNLGYLTGDYGPASRCSCP